MCGGEGHGRVCVCVCGCACGGVWVWVLGCVGGMCACVVCQGLCESSLNVSNCLCAFSLERPCGACVVCACVCVQVNLYLEITQCKRRFSAANDKHDPLTCFEWVRSANEGPKEQVLYSSAGKRACVTCYVPRAPHSKRLFSHLKGPGESRKGRNTFTPTTGPQKLTSWPFPDCIYIMCSVPVPLCLGQ